MPALSAALQTEEQGGRDSDSSRATLPRPLLSHASRTGKARPVEGQMLAQ